MPKGNPNPVITDAFRAKTWKREDDSGEPLADKLLTVRLPRSADEYVRSRPNISVWVRRVITEAVQKEMAKAETPTTPESDSSPWAERQPEGWAQNPNGEEWAYHTKKKVRVKVLKRNGTRTYIEYPDGKKSAVETKHLEVKS